MAIHHNIVRRYALQEDFGHVGGIQVNPGSIGEVFANYIESDPTVSSDNAIQFAGGEDGPSYLYNNVIVGTSIPFVFLTRLGNEDSPVYVYNNTVINHGTGGATLYVGCNAGITQDLEFTNNIFSNYDTIGNYIYTNSNGLPMSKIIYDSGGSCLINGLVYGNDLDQNLTIPGNLYIQDPNQVGFVDYAQGDYRITSSSPAAGVGDDLSSIFTDDYAGNDRGIGQAFDMGAYLAE